MNGEIVGVVSFWGGIAGITALVLLFLFRMMDRDIRVAELQGFIKTFALRSEQTLKQSDEILGLAKSQIASQHVRPDLSTYFANQWKFIEKTFHNRYEKADICRRIVQRYVENNHTVLVDSGSSVDLVTGELLRSDLTNVHVFSNNIFAAMHLVGTKRVSLQLFAGRFNDKFAATYDPDNNALLGRLGINVYILAATAIRHKEGITVHNDDEANREFKRAVIEAFCSSEGSRLIIAVDESKFFEPLENHWSVVSETRWAQIIANHYDRIVLVTAQVQDGVTQEQRLQFNTEIDKFRRSRIEPDIGHT